MHSSRPPSLSHLRPPEHNDCNGKGSPSVLGPTHVSLEENTEDENAEEEVNLVSHRPSGLALMTGFLAGLRPDNCIRLAIRLKKFIRILSKGQTDY